MNALMKWTVAIGIAGGPAFAKSVEVFQGRLEGTEHATSLTPRFRANVDEPDLGRAWVEVTARTESFEGENRVVETTHRVKIDGLAYDPKAKRIVYSKDGRAEVCAAGGSSHPRRPEPKCRLVSRVERQLDDDGFYRRNRLHGIVTLELID